MRHLARVALVASLRLAVRVLAWKLLLAAAAIRAATWAGELAAELLDRVEGRIDDLEGGDDRP